MKIGFSDSQKKFREEIRGWLEKNVPKIPLNSFDTKEGFEEHREWEKKLNSGGISKMEDQLVKLMFIWLRKT